jgi:integrase
MFTRTRFQTGSLKTEKRRRGPAVWVFRWRETDARGKRVKRKLILGTVEQYRSESHARRALAALDLELNEPKHKIATHPALMTVGQLVDHYEKEELREERLSKTQGTVDVYREFLVYWIAPRWKAVRLTEIKPVEVERWLRSLDLANGTKAKIRNILSAVFQHALRHQFITANPIRGLVRQSAKREKEPDVLTAQEIGLILKRLPFRYRIFLAASTGLRFSEIRGLQWQDVDMATGTLNLKRGVVKHHVTPLKTKASRKPVPHPSRSGARSPNASGGRSVQPAHGLGVCQSDEGREGSNLANRGDGGSCASGGKGGEDRQARQLAHFPSLLRDHAQGERRGREDGTGVSTLCQLPDRAGCLHASHTAGTTLRTGKGRGCYRGGAYWPLNGP